MQVQPIALFRLLMSSLAVGIALGVLYDVLRIGRVLIGMNHYTSAATVPAFCPKFCKRRERKSKPRLVMILFNILLVTQDIVFCLTAGAAAAVLLFYHNNGEFRGFVIIAILAGLAAETGLPNRGMFTRPSLYVLKRTNMPAVLVELGFITNSRDARLMNEQPQLFARGVYDGILAYLGL